MSIVFNGTMSLSDGWSEYIIHPQVNLYSARSILLSLFIIPVLAVVLNVLKQLVSWRIFLCLITQNVVFQKVIPGKANEPPVVFHWFPIIGSAVAYGEDPLYFLSKCREKVHTSFIDILSILWWQYNQVWQRVHLYPLRPSYHSFTWNPG